MFVNQQRASFGVSAFESMQALSTGNERGRRNQLAKTRQGWACGRGELLVRPMLESIFIWSSSWRLPYVNNGTDRFEFARVHEWVSPISRHVLATSEATHPRSSPWDGLPTWGP